MAHTTIHMNRPARPHVTAVAARCGTGGAGRGASLAPAARWPSPARQPGRCWRTGWDRRVRVGFGRGAAGSRPVSAGGLREAAGAVAEQPGLGFAELLRQLRAEARLTQEEQAEAAGVSSRSVSDRERGIHRTAHKDTAGLLAGALGLAEPARGLFVSAARGRGPAAEVLAAVRAGGAGSCRGGRYQDPATGYRQLHRPGRSITDG